jgi:cation diffusion facilitator family transporter
VKAVIAALAANLGIAIAKFIAFLLTGSASMLAESVHSLADTGNETLLLIGAGRSRKARTTEHPFGFGRERYFYGFVVAVMLFTIGAVFSIYDGVHKIISPGTLDNPAIAYIVLWVSMILEGLSLRTGIKEANLVRRKGDGWRQFVHVTKTPELPVVLLEDTAALLGLMFAFLGVLLSQLTGHEQWDGVGSVCVGALLACAAFIVGYETKSLLIGESATEETTAQIVAAIESGPEKYRLIHLRTSHIGPDTLLVAAKIGVDADTPARDLSAGIDATEKRIRAAVEIAEIIYLEPDIYRPGEDDPADPSVQVVQQNTTRRRRRFGPTRQG